MLQTDPNERMEFQDRPITPVMTGLLIFSYILIFSIENGLLQPGIHLDGWMMKNCFHLSAIQPDVMQNHDYKGLLAASFTTEFSSFHILQMAFNCYFLWVFGKHVETKLGAARYALLILVGIFVPMFVLYYDCALQQNDTYFVGAPFLLATILGTYMVFPPVPKSRFGKGQTFGKPKNEIFRKGGRPDPLDKYIANPWMFVLVFVVIQSGFHFWITLPKPFFFLTGMPGYDNLIASPILVGVFIGWLVGYLLEQQATAGLKESPMTLLAVKRYHELVDLDVAHDDAIKGTARTLGLPYDKVKQWVAKNKGSMRIK
ncbi:MAG TPA: rhomboid family intramembrane serine protease [Planktothrix sp.]|jgi:membrane associated rhomboid family serine protease